MYHMDKMFLRLKEVIKMLDMRNTKKKRVIAGVVAVVIVVAMVVSMIVGAFL